MRSLYKIFFKKGLYRFFPKRELQEPNRILVANYEKMAVVAAYGAGWLGDEQEDSLEPTGRVELPTSRLRIISPPTPAYSLFSILSIPYLISSRSRDGPFPPYSPLFSAVWCTVTAQ
jgi:hypothetical protein